MTSSEEMMAQIMCQNYRHSYLREVAKLLPLKDSLVLDAGCGVGTLTSLINQHASSANVIGLDFSMHMLTHQVREIAEEKVLIVQACMPRFPFKPDSFNAIVAVQSLSEVLCFAGEEVFLTTIEEINSLLCEGGVFVVLDHQSPGSKSIEAKFTKQLIQQLERFQKLYEYRPFAFNILDGGWVQISMRDLYEFITKIWSFDSPLQKEEMQETHTPYTGMEFSSILEDYGFTIDSVSGAVPFESYLRRYRVRIRPKQNLPERFFIVRASK
ncbi:MAG: class I SAM-dependent methyltransferase [Candidatus Thorarchaeota archaeon]